ncbi:MAG: ABC transporter permease [Planctomycetes bacterium]|nr:ABC transporter permease [Planctomycetota bacterium]
MTVKRFLVRLALGAVPPIAILIVWHVASVGSVVVPSIPAVVEVLAHPFRAPPTLDATSLASGALVSILRVLAGFALAAATAVPIGLLVGRSRTAMDVLQPTMAAAMVISPIAWIPVAIIVFGLSSPATALFGDEAWRYGLLDRVRFAIVAVIWLGAFFPIALNAAAGARGVREAHIESARVLGAGRRQVLAKIILPGAAPAIVTGLRVGGGIAWRVIIAAEIFPGTRGGLGYMIATAHAQASYEYAFASIIVIGAIGLALDGLLHLAAVRVSRWQPKER